MRSRSARPPVVVVAGDVAGVDRPQCVPGVWLNVSQMDGPRPSSVGGALDLVGRGRPRPTRTRPGRSARPARARTRAGRGGPTAARGLHRRPPSRRHGAGGGEGEHVAPSHAADGNGCPPRLDAKTTKRPPPEAGAAEKAESRAVISRRGRRGPAPSGSSRAQVTDGLDAEGGGQLLGVALGDAGDRGDGGVARSCARSCLPIPS